MARMARGEYLDPLTPQIVHVVARCVRRAYLCGKDSVTGRSFEHRREWIRDRLEFLASVFGVDCLTFAVMENHLHLVLRSRPDVVRRWSDEQVARRWVRLCPGDSSTEVEVGLLLADPVRIGQLRVRLSDISWWQRMLSQKIARMANREDDCTGRFWEGRYQAQLLLDEAAVLACAMYVDLNPIRAAMAQSLEDSGFTGAKARIDDLKASGGKKGYRRGTGRPRRTRRWERSRGRRRSGWLSPLELDETSAPLGPDPSTCGRRASLKGFLTMSVTRYLELLDWTGRQLRSGKRGSIPSHVAPILARLGISTEGWLDLAGRFGKLFKRAAGARVSLAAEADRRGQRWMQGPGAGWIG